LAVSPEPKHDRASALPAAERRPIGNKGPDCGATRGAGPVTGTAGPEELLRARWASPNRLNPRVPWCSYHQVAFEPPIARRLAGGRSGPDTHVTVMAHGKLLNLLAVSSLAILACTFGSAPVNALSINTHNDVLVRSHPHADLTRKRSLKKRCKPRSAPSPATTAPNTPTPSPSPKSGSSSGSSTNGARKVGLAWANPNDNDIAHFVTKNVGPVMTWSPYIPPIAKNLGLIPCPMLWGPKQIADFQRLVVPGYANVVLGMNEPNQQGQSDLDPGYAAQLWKQYIQPLKAQGYALVTPACTNAPSGKTWMRAFMNACSGCHFDGLALHWYGTDPQQMIAYLQDMHNTFGLPIWATEFACENFSGGAQCSKDQVWNFMTTVKNFMDGTSWIAHYFAFGVLTNMGNVNPLNQLMGSNGYPNDLGYFYLN
jgi:hypothetical protein